MILFPLCLTGVAAAVGCVFPVPNGVCLSSTGGFQAFERAFPELCEDALMRTKDEMVDAHLVPSYDPYNNCVGVGVGMGMGVGGIPSSPGNEAAIEQAQASEVLPFLYIGNARDAQDLRVLQALGISRVLNVTSHVPGYHQDSGICYKTLPAMDSGHQNLRQYFDEAIHFIVHFSSLPRPAPPYPVVEAINLSSVVSHPRSKPHAKSYPPDWGCAPRRVLVVLKASWCS
ncbi:Dual specificity protein phosphatase 10 [Chionoecetes opilio]|uniref:Dual specificity protein phosphatase 10 n=1 Tax=Chionoecetes opilio TaxID=41210 RepID=A0A8J8WMT8_CHIOP|nr:Dual specificity protein phosphatase 10 [Chionoecetes opilio]